MPPLPPPVVLLDPFVPPVELALVVPSVTVELLPVVASLPAPPTEPASVVPLLTSPVVWVDAVVALSDVLAPPLPPASLPEASLVAEAPPPSVSLVFEECSAEPHPTRLSKAAQ